MTIKTRNINSYGQSCFTCCKITELYISYDASGYFHFIPDTAEHYFLLKTLYSGTICRGRATVTPLTRKLICLCEMNCKRVEEKLIVMSWMLMCKGHRTNTFHGFSWWLIKRNMTTLPDRHTVSATDKETATGISVWTVDAWRMWVIEIHLCFLNIQFTLPVGHNAHKGNYLTINSSALSGIWMKNVSTFQIQSILFKQICAAGLW